MTVAFAKLIIIFLVTRSQSFAQTPANTNGIVFSGSTTTTTTVSPVTPSGCRCVSQGSCPQTNPGINIRIVNQSGSANCPVGQIWCCGTSQPLTDACGMRKVTNAPNQPPGTAKYAAYPWQVAILAMDNTYLGSGVLIDSRHILTAAHKVSPFPNRNFKIRLGDWDGQATTEVYPYREYSPERVFLHPNYNSASLQHDIAVVRINGEVPLAASPNINTACLPNSAPAAGTRCWVAGWGKNAFGALGAYQSILKEVDVPIVEINSCELRLRTTRLGAFFVLDRNSFLCAGGEVGKDACTGDGGAPLVCQSSTGQWHVVALVAWGIGCAASGVPGVYINVFNYLQWINQQIATP